MLVIRLRRIGKKNKPTYRIVVAEHSFPIDGRFVEDLGYYNPHSKDVGLNKEKATEWMKKGAKPSNTVAKIMEREKIKHKSVVVVKSAKKAKKSEEKGEKPAAATAETAPEVAGEVKQEVKEGETPKEPEQAEEPPKEEARTDKKDS